MLLSHRRLKHDVGEKKCTNLGFGDLLKLLLKVRESVVENSQTAALPEVAGEKTSIREDHQRPEALKGSELQLIKS